MQQQSNPPNSNPSPATNPKNLFPPQTKCQPPSMIPQSNPDNFMPLPVIDDIDIAIAEADEDNAIVSSHTYYIAQ